MPDYVAADGTRFECDIVLSFQGRCAYSLDSVETQNPPNPKDYHQWFFHKFTPVAYSPFGTTNIYLTDFGKQCFGGINEDYIRSIVRDVLEKLGGLRLA